MMVENWACEDWTVLWRDLNEKREDVEEVVDMESESMARGEDLEFWEESKEEASWGFSEMENSPPG